MPYSTCESANSFVIHRIVTSEEVMLVAVTADIAGGAPSAAEPTVMAAEAVAGSEVTAAVVSAADGAAA
jgi:hypothetical protein